MRTEKEILERLNILKKELNTRNISAEQEDRIDAGFRTLEWVLGKKEF